jgi:hypothetical protein
MHEYEFLRNICGRSVTWDDAQMIRELIREHPSALRTELSRKVCLAWNWVKPDGGLKDMSCRLLLLKLHRAGVIELPAPQNGNNNGRKFLQLTAEGEPGEPIHDPVGALYPIELERVRTKADSFLWNELIERYHYLGYTPLPGAQIRYFIRSPFGRLGAIGFSAAAWKVQPRDAWIGWVAPVQKQNLHLIVGNSRFLILPWVNSKNLASHVLSLCARHLPHDWQQTYGYTPVLMETFVEKDRFAGTCYKAANWSYVGATKGRGKLDRYNEYALPVKEIYLYPLHKRFRKILQDS